MSDTFSVDIRAPVNLDGSGETGALEHALAIVLGQHRVTGWADIPDPNYEWDGDINKAQWNPDKMPRILILFWSDYEAKGGTFDYNRLMTDARTPGDIALMVRQWLAKEKAEGRLPLCMDFDGDTGDGFRMWTNGWGFVSLGSKETKLVNLRSGACAIAFDWMLYGK